MRRSAYNRLRPLTFMGHLRVTLRGQEKYVRMFLGGSFGWDMVEELGISTLIDCRGGSGEYKSQWARNQRWCLVE